MTLPFRRRHHDDESAHDRARAIWSHGFLDPIEPADAAWLEDHLAGCGECRIEHEAFVEDRRLLRSLREAAPEPPRDLWARTSASIEREAGRRGRRGAAPGPWAERVVPPRARAPLGVLSGLLVVLVVVATSLVPRGGVVPGTTPQGSTAVAQTTPQTAPSPLAVDAAPLGWLQTGADGSYQLILADVDEVCPNQKTGCAPLEDSSTSALRLGSPPQSIVGSPTNDQIVVVSGGAGSDGNVLVVPVPTPAGPHASPSTGSSPPAGTPTAVPQTPAVTAPGGSANGSLPPSPLATPEGAHSIAVGVTVVGATAYSADGQWLAFSARPIDGSAGPDLYVWHVGDASAALVTSDHRTFFSGWLGGRILASRVDIGAASTPSAPAETAAASPIVAPVEAHPMSFLFDPATSTSVDLDIPDIWLPTVDPTGRFTAYWSGTVLPDESGLGWRPATGRLVLDGWGQALDEGPGSPASPEASPKTSAGADRIGPAGTPVELAAGPLAAFDATFDPATGTRLAVWIADPANVTVGTLRLVVLDAGRGRVNRALDPLPPVAAMRGFSIEQGRLAWVTPPGQDGNQSTVQVLAWSNDDFGLVQTIPSGRLYIVR